MKKARDERVGGIPYGMRLATDGKRLEEHTGEQDTVARARALRREGRSLRAISRSLIEAGHAPRRGKKWHVQVLARIVGLQGA